MIRASIYLSTNEVTGLDKICSRSGVSRNLVIRLAIQELLGRLDEQSGKVSILSDVTPTNGSKIE